MKHNYLNKLLKRIEGQSSSADKFHRRTNNKNNIPKKPNQIPLSWIKIHFKTYPRFDRILFNNIKPIKSELSEILRKRRSVRQFSGLSISKDELFSLLFSSCGLTYLGETFDNSRRPYPSAGGRYPLEVYPIILNCEELKRGLYHFNVKETSLESLLKEDLSKWLTRVTYGEKWIKNAAVVFIIAGVLNRIRIKYGDRGYRYVLIEAGHLGQNICLLATELDLGSCPLGGFIDDEVNKLLDINLQKEVSLYMIAIGKV